MIYRIASFAENDGCSLLPLFSSASRDEIRRLALVAAMDYQRRAKGQAPIEADEQHWADALLLMMGFYLQDVTGHADRERLTPPRGAVSHA